MFDLNFLCKKSLKLADWKFLATSKLLDTKCVGPKRGPEALLAYTYHKKMRGASKLRFRYLVCSFLSYIISFVWFESLLMACDTRTFHPQPSPTSLLLSRSVCHFLKIFFVSFPKISLVIFFCCTS